MFVHRPPTRDEHLAWFESDRWDRVDYVVVHRDADAPIGVVNFKDIDGGRRTAETGTLIGDAARRGQGYAHEAKVAWMLYGFAVLELDAVFVHIRADNARMIEIDTKLGHVAEARPALDTSLEAGVPFIRMRLDAATALRHPAFVGAPDPHGFRARLALRLGHVGTGSLR